MARTCVMWDLLPLLQGTQLSGQQLLWKAPGISGTVLPKLGLTGASHFDFPRALQVALLAARKALGSLNLAHSPSPLPTENITVTKGPKA